MRNGAIDAVLDRGLRGLWYPIAPSWAVGSAPVGLTRLGERLVVWRDGAGSVHVLEDRCPHRGAPLSLGWNLGDRLACWYHGVQVDGGGAVVRVPAVATCPLEGKTSVRRYPAREAAGAIFAYFASGAKPPPELVLPEQISSDAYAHFLSFAFWKCNYRYVMDNTLDPMHGIYLHAHSHSMTEGRTEAKMRVRTTPTGFIFEKEDQHSVNLDWSEFGDSNWHWMRTETPYRKNAGPGGNFWIVGAWVPVDEAHCVVFFWRARKVRGWQRAAWRFLYKTRLEGLHWQVLEQDRALLENMPRDARAREFLYEHDVGLARVRRHLEKKAEAQIAATEL